MFSRSSAAVVIVTLWFVSTGTARAESDAGTSAGDDEALIRAYRDLGQKPDNRAALDRFVADHPDLLHAKAKPYGSALMWVLEFEEEEAALALIRAGAPVVPSSPGEAGPLHLAARGGLDGLVKAMLARGASATAEDYWGTPLHFAAEYGHANTMRLLLRAGANPNAAADDHRFTPLHHAVIGRHTEAVRVLIAAHADLEAKDDDGQTPLHWGGFAYRPQPVHRYNMKNTLPHDTSYADPGPAEAMKLLLDAGARIEAVDSGGNTPLHEAVLVGSRRGVELLVARGAKVNAKNSAGETPLSIAKTRIDPEIIRLLEQPRP